LQGKRGQKTKKKFWSIIQNELRRVGTKWTQRNTWESQTEGDEPLRVRSDTWACWGIKDRVETDYNWAPAKKGEVWNRKPKGGKFLVKRLVGKKRLKGGLDIPENVHEGEHKKKKEGASGGGLVGFAKNENEGA